MAGVVVSIKSKLSPIISDSTKEVSSIIITSELSAVISISVINGFIVNLLSLFATETISE